MAQPKKPRSRKRPLQDVIQPEWPVWYFPDTPLGSAVRYIASLSPHFTWIGISILKNKVFELGPHLGAARQNTRFEWSVEIQNKKGKTLGRIEIDTYSEVTVRLDEEILIRQVA